MILPLALASTLAAGLIAIIAYTEPANVKHKETQQCTPTINYVTDVL